MDHAAHASQPLNGTLESGARCILCEAQAVDMHLFLFAASEKSSRAFSKFEIVRMEPRNWEACEKCGVGPAQLVRSVIRPRLGSILGIGPTTRVLLIGS